MQWEREGWVRAYRRQTADWLAMPWQARFLFDQLVKMAEFSGPDRGVVRLGAKAARAIAAAINCPVDVVETALAELLEDGCIVRVPNGLRIRNYMPAQDTPKSNALKCKDYRVAVTETRKVSKPTPLVSKTTPRDTSPTGRDTRATETDTQEEEQKEEEKKNPPNPLAGAGDQSGDVEVEQERELTKAEKSALRDVAMARAYSAGVSQATGREHVVPSADLGTLRMVVTTHAKGLRLAPLDAWLTERGAAYVRARPEARFEAGYSMPRFLAWLNAGAPATNGHSGPTKPEPPKAPPVFRGYER